MKPARRSSGSRARLVGMNHIALEVGDIESALAFYGQLFDFRLRGRSAHMAFIDMGDQFIALSEGPTAGIDRDRHVGLVVDDKEKVRRRLKPAGAKVIPGRSVEFRDPWGNRIQIVPYPTIQFTKEPAVLSGMGCGDLRKTPAALRELARKGLTAGPSKRASQAGAAR